MKKAFCEPGNTKFCPPISVSSVFCFGPSAEGSLTIKRSEDNGGDVTYTNVTDLEKDFGDGSLHPGDLKAAVTAVTLKILENLAQATKADKEATQAAKTLKAFQKKLSKMKK